MPSLSTLQAFEGAARLASFTRAGTALNLTQGAISRHVRALEDRLGVELFHRVGQRVVLTVAGERYYQAISPSLDDLEQATRSIRSTLGPVDALQVVIPPTFGARWLLPRLAAFAARHRAIPVQLSDRSDVLAAGATSFDVAIVGGPPPAGLPAQPLETGDLVPVCSPALVAQCQTGGLRSTPLLELGPPGAWAAFAVKHRQSALGKRVVTSFEYFDAGIQAAIAGQGILLAPPFLVLRDLHSGALTIPIAARIEDRHGYSLCFPKRRRRPASAQHFVDWIIGSMGESNAECEALLAA